METVFLPSDDGAEKRTLASDTSCLQDMMQDLEDLIAKLRIDIKVRVERCISQARQPDAVENGALRGRHNEAAENIWTGNGSTPRGDELRVPPPASVLPGHVSPPPSRPPEAVLAVVPFHAGPVDDERGIAFTEHQSSLVVQAPSPESGKKKMKKKKTNFRNFLELNSESGPGHCITRMVNSQYYQVISACMILLNAIFIGAETQFMADFSKDCLQSMPPQEVSEPAVLARIGAAFNILFAVELMLRWIGAGFVDFFREADVWWNVMDFLVVGIGLLDVIMELAVWLDTGSSSESGLIPENLSMLRILRVCRVVRVIRFVRVMRFFRELRMMVYSIIGSFKSLLWIALVLGTMFYLFGISFTTAITQHINTPGKWRNSDNVLLFERFGTLDRAALSLFMAMSGGLDWGDLLAALDPLQGQYACLFLIYITLSIFAVANIVTSVFLDCAMQIHQRDKEVVVHEEIETKKEAMEQLKDLFEKMDADGTGSMTLQEFEDKLDKERVVAYFNTIKLDVSEARTLFCLLDYDDSNEVSIDEFVNGCYKLMGEATALETNIMHCEVKFLKENLQHLATELKELRALSEADILCRLVPSSRTKASLQHQLAYAKSKSSHSCTVVEGT